MHKGIVGGSDRNEEFFYGGFANGARYPFEQHEGGGIELLRVRRGRRENVIVVPDFNNHAAVWRVRPADECSAHCPVTGGGAPC